jgi:hypothetical protein
MSHAAVGEVSRRRVFIAAGVTVVVVAAVVIAWRGCACTPGLPDPTSSIAPCPRRLRTSDDTRSVSAHNAGNNAATTGAALEYGADVIEIDVITAHGRLVAGRAHGWPWLAKRVFRGQTLASAWQHAETAKIIKLDLQQTDHGLLVALLGFLRTVPAGRPVMVSTRDAAAIEYARACRHGHAAVQRAVSGGGDPHS